MSNKQTTPSDSLSISPVPPEIGPAGQVAHPLAVEHHQRLQRQLYRIGDHAWCLVGNGLSNQVFVRGPGGIIAIDTGESIEEMSSALNELRSVTTEPIVAVIYTHFHYVAGTQAIYDAQPGQRIDIYGHTGIPNNLKRFGGEIAARSNRGMVHQFGLSLPDQGTDALLHCGLGLFYRNPEHAPFTPGHVPAHIEFDAPCEFEIAGLEVQITPAPSDATDSITIYFPALKLCVNNLLWPALFNIYAIRGEEYRDPRVLLSGLDHIAQLDPDALLCTHGPPIEGAQVAPAIELYRDAIAFIWDQTVRGANQGWSLSDLTARIELPACYASHYFTQQLYGLVEHHVRQIHGGLFGWFDEDPSHLFPLPSADRASRLVAGFGGVDTVRNQVDQALAEQDWRWALELATWLHQHDSSAATDAVRLAAALRGVAQHSSAANIRNWCLTRALELEGDIDLSRHRQSRFGYSQVLAADPTHYIPVLRVLVDPERCADLRGSISWQFPNGARAGLEVRNHVAVPTDGRDAQVVLGMSHETWATVLANRQTFKTAVAEGLISIDGDEALCSRLLAVFDHPGLRD